MYFVLAATAAFYCVVAIWAATSRQHWLIRTMVPVLALAILLPVQAHEPLIFFSVVMAEIAALFFAWRAVMWIWKARPALVVPALEATARRPWIVRNLPNLSAGMAAMLRNDLRNPIAVPRNSIRFGLRDLLLAMVPAAIAAFIASQFVGVGILMLWPDALYASLWLATIALLGWGIITSRWRWMIAVLFVLAMARAGFVDAQLLGDWIFAGQMIGPQKSLASFGVVSGGDILIQTMGLYVLTSICLLTGFVILALFRSERRGVVSRLVAGSLLTFPAVVLVIVYWQMLTAVEIPDSPPLAQNVYPQLLRLYHEPKPAAVIIQESLELLDRPGCVVIDWSQAAVDPVAANDFSEIADYRSLARSLQSAAETLHAAGKHDEAARYELAILKLGAMHLRSGLVIHALTGISVEGIGMWLVARHHTSYSPDVRRQIIAQLIELKQAREPAEVTTARDRAFENLAWRWRTRLIWAVDRLVEVNSAAPAHEHHQFALRRQLADEQIVLAELAIGLFHSDHGRLPATLEELVPDYLPEVPRDLHGSGSLNYRVTDTGYVLYSVSHDGRDDGGKFGTRIQSMVAGYDLDLGTIAK